MADIFEYILSHGLMICGTRNRGYFIPYLVNETSRIELLVPFIHHPRM
ncbi:MAG: hypothetical protein ACTHMI_22145 [Mucilaginibacter sp.]